MVSDWLVYLVYMVFSLYVSGCIIPVFLYRDQRLSIRVGLVFGSFASLLLVIVSMAVVLTSTRVYIDGVFEIDGFSAIFLAVIGLAGLSSSIYGLGYMDIYSEIGGGWLYSVLFNGFLLSMALLPMITDLLWFVFVWEIMTLTSIVLIGWDYNTKHVVYATKQYMYAMLILNSILLITSTALAWMHYGTTSLKDIQRLISYSDPVWMIILVSMYIAFTSKTGLFPLHFWLPDAHPAAPSNVSSLLSGVMIKMGVYGLVGILYRYLGLPTWLYYVLLVQGLLSIIWGSIKAIGENHAKRLLAYSSISQIGYITVPISLAFIIYPQNAVAGEILLASALLYLYAHSLFKTLLFLASGCYIYMCGTAQLDKVKGVAWIDKALFIGLLVGVFSIAALPPFMGFLAKITLYGATLLGNNLLYGVVAVLLIALSPLTLLYSLKLLVPAIHLRFDHTSIKRITASMRIGLLLPSILLVVLGVYVLYGGFLSVATGFLEGASTGISEASLVQVLPPYIYYSPLLVLSVLLAGVLAGYMDSGRGIHVSSIWTTGYRIPLDRHRVRPGYLYSEFTRIFEPVTSLAHEIYYCIIYGIPSRLISTGIASGLTRFFGSLNKWLADGLVGLSKQVSRGREYKLDEAAGSAIVSIIRLVGNLARLFIVSPIGLFALALLFLSLIILILVVIVGG